MEAYFDMFSGMAIILATLSTLAGLAFLYYKFFTMAMKGDLDLDVDPEKGGMKKQEEKIVLYFRNPFKKFERLME